MLDDPDSKLPEPPAAVNPTLQEIFDRLRVGDEDAARWLVDLYGPALKREIRFQVRDDQLRRVVDSSDIFQSVMRSFFVGCRLGEFELRTPAELFSLLRVIARNKINSQRRYHSAAQRDIRRLTSLDVPRISGEIAARESHPLGDSLSDVLERLDEVNRRVAALRIEGQTWGEIATLEGEAEENVRKRFRRALDRVLAALDSEKSGE